MNQVQWGIPIVPAAGEAKDAALFEPIEFKSSGQHRNPFEKEREGGREGERTKKKEKERGR